MLCVLAAYNEVTNQCLHYAGIVAESPSVRNGNRLVTFGCVAIIEKLKLQLYQDIQKKDEYGFLMYSHLASCRH